MALSNVALFLHRYGNWKLLYDIVLAHFALLMLRWLSEVTELVDVFQDDHTVHDEIVPIERLNPGQLKGPRMKEHQQWCSKCPEHAVWRSRIWLIQDVNERTLRSLLLLWKKNSAPEQNRVGHSRW